MFSVMKDNLHKGEPLIIHYNKGFAIIFLILGPLLFLAQLFLMSYDIRVSGLISMVTAIFVTIIGFRYLRGAYFEFYKGRIELKNLYGVTVKKHEFSSIEQLSFIDGKIYLEKDGKSKRIRLSKMMSRQDEWDQFIYMITKDDYTKELHND